MVTIYADVLIVLNIYVNFFLLRITARITHTPVKTGRCIAASVVGSLFSLLILAPRLGDIVNAVIRLPAAFLIIWISFGCRSVKRLLLNTGAFLAANLVLAGSIYAVYSWLAPGMVHFNNTYFYIDFSLMILILTTAVLYFLVWIAGVFSGVSAEGDDFRVIVRYRDKILDLHGLADTGNVLVDLFTGIPVIVCDRSSFGFNENSELPKGYRLLPCSTISDSGVIPVFRPDEVLIVNSLSGDRKAVDVMIGLGKDSGRAIFNPKLLKI